MASRDRSRRCWADTGGFLASVNRGGLRKGVVKIGWSWEAKYVWFFSGQDELAHHLREMLLLPGCASEFCLVQVAS